MIRTLFFLVLMLIAVTSLSAQAVLKAHINIDSNIIHYPNDRIYMNADSCRGMIALTQWLQVSGPNRAYWKSLPGGKMMVYNLIPGNYRFQLFVNDKKDDTASAYVNVRVVWKPKVVIKK